MKDRLKEIHDKYNGSHLGELSIENIAKGDVNYLLAALQDMKIERDTYKVDFNDYQYDIRETESLTQRLSAEVQRAYRWEMKYRELEAALQEAQKENKRISDNRYKEINGYQIDKDNALQKAEDIKSLLDSAIKCQCELFKNRDELKDKLKQAEERERVLREALEEVLKRECYEVESFENGQLVGKNTHYSRTGRIAEEALEKVKP